MVISPASPPLSVLDFGQVVAGQSRGDAIAETVALARAADTIGYRRFLVSEHHTTPWLASTSPAVLIAAIAARTRRIVVGSGGVMLPNHAPLVVAEEFALLDDLHPGRIELGLGRAPGADAMTAAALRRTEAGADADAFAEEVRLVEALLQDSSTSAQLARAVRGLEDRRRVGAPPIRLLGSSDVSARLAGRLGLAFAFAGHNGIPPAVAAHVLEIYRSSFVPRGIEGALPAPHALLSAAVVAADSEEEVDWIARPGRLQRLAERTGRPPQPFLSPADAAQVQLTAREEYLLSAMPTGGAAGTPDRVAAELKDLISQTGADELLLCSFLPGLDYRTAVLERVWRAWTPDTLPDSDLHAPTERQHA